jgi:hypothetical protein
MEIFDKSMFLSLSKIHKPHCVSIYIPTQRAGGPKGIQEDRIRFKNQLKLVAQKLGAYGLKEPQVKEYLAPARQLLEDEVIWSHQSDGLAVFLYGETMEYYTVPIKFEEDYHIEDNLYLMPLIPLLTDEGRHFIMPVSLNSVRFFEATRHTITPVTVEGLIPQTLEEAVGTDFEQKSLQFRSGHSMSPESATFHGHGSGQMPEKKEEIQKYFNALDEGLMKMLHDEQVPLVLACVDYLFPIYKESNSYDFLKNDFISGNHDETSPLELHTKSWEIVGKKYDKDREEAMETFNLKLSAAKASFNEAEVIAASLIGRTEILFVRKGSKIWGIYDPDDHKVDIDSMDRVGNAELLNQAAIKTVTLGGKVIYVESGEMPEEMGKVAATYRYAM